jgi:hypothetical protein
MSLPHTNPEAKQRLMNSHVSTWVTPEYTALIQAATDKARRPRCRT